MVIIVITSIQPDIREAKNIKKRLFKRSDYPILLIIIPSFPAHFSLIVSRYPDIFEDIY